MSTSTPSGTGKAVTDEPQAEEPYVNRYELTIVAEAEVIKAPPADAEEED